MSLPAGHPDHSCMYLDPCPSCREKARPKYRVTIRLDPDKRWTARATLPVGERYTYATEGVLVTVDFDA